MNLYQFRTLTNLGAKGPAQTLSALSDITRLFHVGFEDVPLPEIEITARSGAKSEGSLLTYQDGAVTIASFQNQKRFTIATLMTIDIESIRLLNAEKLVGFLVDEQEGLEKIEKLPFAQACSREIERTKLETSIEVKVITEPRIATEQSIACLHHHLRALALVISNLRKTHGEGVTAPIRIGEVHFLSDTSGFRVEVRDEKISLWLPLTLKKLNTAMSCIQSALENAL